MADAKNRSPQLMPGEPRVPLSMAEHQAFRQIAACLTGIRQSEAILEKRMRRVKNGWNKYRILSTVVVWVYDALVRSIPPDKLERTKMELDNCRYDIYTDFIKCADHERGFVCIRESTLVKLAMAVQNQCCCLCDKSGKDVKKCKLRKTFCESLNFEIPDENGGECFFSVYSVGNIGGKNDEFE